MMQHSVGAAKDTGAGPKAGQSAQAGVAAEKTGQDGRSWRRFHVLFGWLNLALAAPVIYLYIGLPMVMREHGWSGTEIGLLQLAGLPAILKFLVATPIDRYRLGRSSYRNWSMTLLAAYAAALLLFAMCEIGSTPLWLLLLIAMLVNVLAAWADVPVNALAIRVLPESERIRAGAVRSAATSLGAIAGGGVMLLIQSRWGWAWPFLVLAACLGLGVLLLPMANLKAQTDTAAQTAVRAGGREWRSYFNSAPRSLWAMLLLLYFPFIGAAWVYLKPLLIDQNFAPQQIALVVGVGGGTVAAASSLASIYLTRRMGAGLALPLYALAACVAVAALAAALLSGMPLAILIAAMMIALAMGAQAGLIFGLMMHFTRPGLAAVDYGIQSSLFICARSLVPLAAGVLLDRHGHLGLLSGLLLGSVLALSLALRYRGRLGAAWQPALSG